MTEGARKFLIKLAIAVVGGWIAGMASGHVFMRVEGKRVLGAEGRVELVQDASQWAFRNAHGETAETLIRLRIELFEACKRENEDSPCREVSSMKPYLMIAALYPEGAKERGEWEEKAAGRGGVYGSRRRAFGCSD